MRRLALVVLLLLAPSAQAAPPTALGPSDSVALADGAAYVGHVGDDAVTVTRIPLDGGPRTVILDQALTGDQSALITVAAAPERVGVQLSFTDHPGGLLQSFEVRAGPPEGPLTTITEPSGLDHPEAPWPSTVAAASDTVFINELQGSDNRWIAVAPDGTRKDLGLPRDRGALRFAGDLMAYGELVGDETIEDLPTHLVIRNWRTGATVRTRDLRYGISSLDLRADGRVLLGLARGRLYELTAGGRLRRLHDGFSPTAAGDGIVVRHVTVVTRGRNLNQTERLELRDGAGEPLHPIGLRTRYLSDLAADDDHVVWRSNGCAFVASVDEGPSRTFANAGCLASEPDLVAPKRPPRVARTVRLPVRCLNAADGICRGSLAGDEFASRRYAVRAGKRKRVAVHIRPDAYRALRSARVPFLNVTDPMGPSFFLRR